MLNKKGQGMPMNVIIIAIIILVVLIILIAFFAGGFGSITGKIRELFTGQVSGQTKDTTIQTCQSMCDIAKNYPASAQRSSGYCTNSYVVDMDSNPDTPPQRISCGSMSRTPIATQEDNDKGINVGGNLGIECSGVVCAG